MKKKIRTDVFVRSIGTRLVFSFVTRFLYLLKGVIPASEPESSFLNPGSRIKSGMTNNLVQGVAINHHGKCRAKVTNKIFVMGVIMSFAILPGCSKKEKAVSKATAVREEAQAQALPELEQNKIYMTNQEEPAPPPDISFHPDENVSAAKSSPEIPVTPPSD